MTKLLMIFLCSVLIISCNPTNKKHQQHTANNNVSLYNKKSLECERRNWNRVPKNAGYVQHKLRTQQIVNTK
ncbi:hypothetical protein CAP35_06320 [Chitinophagaceae bacterium IBVUCB1]|nr:hypothetical protein CAP35_06320 [Chitinophagaceae bacterium IBVUCB1]